MRRIVYDGQPDLGDVGTAALVGTIAPTWTALRCSLSDGSPVLVWHVSETRLGERTTACGALISAMDWILGPKAYAELDDQATLCRPCAISYGAWAMGQ